MSRQVQVGNRDTAIRTIIAEAASEGVTGMLAVAAVARNRASQTGLSIEDIFLQRGQFEPHMTVDGRARMARQRPGSTLWTQAEQALNRALAGEDPTGGADHFFSPGAQSAAGRARPRWAVPNRARTIGRHEFFRLGYGSTQRTRNTVAAGEASPVSADVAAAARPQIAPLSLPERETLAASLWSGSPTDAIRARASGDTSKPDTMTEREAWGQRMDETTQANLPGGRVTNSAAVGAAINDALDAPNERPDPSLGRMIGAAWDGTITATIGRVIERHLDPSQPDPGFKYVEHMAQLEEGRSLSEREFLRKEARSLNHAREIIAQQDQRRQDRQDLNSPEGMAVNLAVNIVDPAGWAVGAGVTAGIGKAGLSAATIARATNPGLIRSAGVLGLVATDSAIGNVAATGTLQALGEQTTVDDYMSSALFGAAIGAPLGALGLGHVNSIPGPRQHIAAVDLTPQANAVMGAVAEQRLADVAVASGRVPEGATPGELVAAVNAVERERVLAAFDNTQNPIPEANRIFDPTYQITPEQSIALDDLTITVGDQVEAGLLKIATQRLADVGENIPTTTDAGPLEQAWIRSGAASVGMKLTRSDYAPLRGANAVLFEGTTGHNGRQHSVALEVHMRETELNRELRPYDSAYEAWRRSKGYTAWDMAYNERVQTEWNESVWHELRRRERPDLYTASGDAAVVAAADAFRNFYKKAGDEQVKWGAIGSGAIDTANDWYIPQEVSGARLKDIKQAGTMPIYQRMIQEQARGIFGWDDEFSKFFSAQYFDLALNRANGGFTIPTRLDHPSAGEFVSDLLENMRDAAGNDGKRLNTIQEFEKKFERGGPGYSKKRLDFDVMHGYEIDGKTYRLGDVMNKDMLNLARTYGRRSAANVALTKAGIPGRYGLDLLRKSMSLAHDAGKIKDYEMKAFEQGLAEISGIPIGMSNRVTQSLESVRMVTAAIKLGGAAFNQFAEYFNGFATVGIRNTLAQIPAMPRMLKELKTLRDGGPNLNPILRTVDSALGYEIGLENYIMDRVFDIPLDGVTLYGADSTSVISKTARASSYLVAKYSGQRVLTAVQTRGMADVLSKQMIRYIKDGKGPSGYLGTEKTAKVLEDIGINSRLRDRIAANMDRIAKFDSRGSVIELDLRGGDLNAAEVAEIAGSIMRGSHQIIQRTYAGEVGAWAHDPFLRMLTQFRTFSLTAVEKQWGRQVRTVGHARVIGAMLGALPFVFAIHAARVQITTLGMPEEKRQETIEKRMHPAALAQSLTNYMSASGMLGDIMDIGGGTVNNVANSLGTDAPDFLEGVGNVRGGMVGGQIAPSVGVMNDIGALAQGDISKVRRLLPGQSIPALAIPLNIVEGGLDDLTDDED